MKHRAIPKNLSASLMADAFHQRGSVMVIKIVVMDLMKKIAVIPTLYYCCGKLNLIYYFSSVKTCPNTEFQCENGDCVPITYRCDGQPDCGDTSDEYNCGMKITVDTFAI